MLESYIEDKACARAKANGFLYRKVRWLGRRGAPDRMFARKDTGPFLVEFKKPGEDLKPHQVREIARLRDHGWTVHVIDNLDDALALFG